MILDLLQEMKSQGIQLWLDGERLRFQAPQGTMTPQKKTVLRTHKLEIIAFLREANQSQEQGAATIEKADRNQPLPLLFSQQRLWFIDRFEGASGLYNMSCALQLRGLLDTKALESSFKQIIARHEILRTRFVEVDGEPFQEILPDIDFVISASTTQPQDVKTQASQWAATPFDLACDALIRAHLFVISEQDQVLAVSMHHMISDGWSLGVFVRELTAIYAAFCNGLPSPLLPLKLQFADVALWQQTSQGRYLEQARDYWRERLKDAPGPLELPHDFPRPTVQTYRGKQHPFRIPPAVMQRLESLSREHRVTLFTTMRTTLAVLLARLSGSNDICLGSPVSGRGHSQIEPLIGFFVNTLVYRTTWETGATFTDLLQQAWRTDPQDLNWANLPFDQVLETCAIPRNQSHSPLFQVMFALQKANTLDLSLPGLKVTSLPLINPFAKFDLTFAVTELGEAELEYNTGLFSEATAKHIVSLYQHMLAHLETHLPVHRLSFMSQPKIELISSAWNKTETPYPADASLCSLFEAQVRATPQHSAYEWAGDKGAMLRLDYASLNAQSNALAKILAQNGVKPGSVIGLHTKPSPNMMVALVAIIKLGATYLPLDPAYPAERLQFMLKDSHAGWLLIEDGLHLEIDPAVVRLSLSQNFEPSETHPALELSPMLPAYIIYTSGSTGTPKGTVICQRSVVRLVHGQKHFQPQVGERVARQSNISFDAATYEIWGSLLHGATMVETPADTFMEPGLYGDWVQRHKLEHMFLTVAIFNQTIKEVPHAFGKMKSLLVGGEALNPATVHQCLETAGPKAFCNGYGPTECTTFAITRVIEQVPQGAISLPLGEPIANTTAHVVDAHLQLNPLGVYGELLLGGVGLAMCYHNQARRTATQFIPNPFTKTPGDRLYRTGDLVRRDHEGTLWFQGRIDHQIKLRGFRIELGEIEMHLNQMVYLSQAIVLVRGQDEARRLVAFAQGDTQDEGHDLETDALTVLRDQLPEYMIPSRLIILKEIPLTANGKINRKALIDMDITLASSQKEYVAPRTPHEILLAEAFADLLAVDRIGIHDDFFSLGGHSLLATKLTARIRKQLKLEVPIRLVFSHPILADLAKALEREGQSVTQKTPIFSQADPSHRPLSLAQERLWFMDTLGGPTTAHNMPASLELRGFLDAAKLEEAVTLVITRHESLRIIVADTDGSPELQPLSCPFSLEIDDLSHLGSEMAAQQAQQISHKHGLRLFDIRKGPLFSLRLIKLARDRHVFLVNMHHIISDGWSLGIFIKETSHSYRQLMGAETAPLLNLPIQYSDYVIWQRHWLAGDVIERQLDWWKAHLAGTLPILELPTDRPRTAHQEHTGGSVQICLDPTLCKKIHHVTQSNGATIFMTLLAAFKILLGRITRSQEVIVGFPIAGRTHQELEPLIGFFINTLALRTDLGDDVNTPSFLDILGKVREGTLGAFEHQEMPFPKLVEVLQPERDLSRNPIFQVFFNMLNTPEVDVELPGLEIIGYHQPEIESKFDLTLYAREQRDAIALTFHYNAALFDESRIQILAEQYQILLNQLVAKPKATIFSHSLRTGLCHAVLPDSRKSLSTVWPGSVIDLFAEMVKKDPHNLAIADPTGQWDFQRFDSLTQALANRLLDHGLQKGDRVAVFAHRSASLPLALMATLRAGGVFVILDPQYPQQRLCHFLEVAKPKVWLAQTEAGTPPEAVIDWLARTQLQLALTLPAGMARLVNFFKNDEAKPLKIYLKPEDAACLTFTSGSSGKPKGVLGRHGSLSHHIPFLSQRFAIGPESRFSMLSGLSHDPLQRDIFTPLNLGGALIIPHTDDIAPAALPTWMHQTRITDCNLTPAMCQVLTETASSQKLPHLKNVFFVGEALTRNVLARLKHLAPKTRAVNLYGTTETQRAMGYYVAADEDFALPKSASVSQALPLGKGFPSVQLLIGNGEGPMTAIGEMGEIRIRSPYLARGYVADETLTQTRFLKNPHRPDDALDRCYRTGDLGYYRADGTVMFAGRCDFQMKIRGFRIEPSEIEGVLLQHKSVREAVVLAVGEQSQVLVAYLVPENDTEIMQWNSATLRTFLSPFLPDYMIPTHVISLPALPLTANHKLDRRALPRPDQTELGRQNDYVAPRTQMETTLCQIWSDVLHQDNVGIHHNFFDLGGHSLIATQVLARIHKMLGLTLPLRILFEAPTIALLANALATQGRAEQGSASIALAPRNAGAQNRLSFAQERLWVLSRMVGTSAAYNMPFAVRLTGQVDAEILDRALVAVIDRHEILRTRYRETNQGIIQILDSPPSSLLTYEDLEAVASNKRETTALLRAKNAILQPFDLETDLPIRAHLFRLDMDQAMLVLCVHHIASDGWSTGILVNELASLYRAFEADAAPPLQPLPIQYFDYAQWQRGETRAEILQRQRAFWKNALSGAPTQTPLPYDIPPSPQRNYRGSQKTLRLPPELISQAKAFAGQQQSGLFPVLLASLNILLYRWTQSEDVVVGTVVAGREQAELESLIGCFMNFLALRSQPKSTLSGEAYVQEVRACVLEAFSHQTCPFEQVLADRREQEAGADGLYNVAFLLQNHVGRTPFTDQIQAEQVVLGHDAALLDLRFIGFELEDGGLELVCEYDVDLFRPKTIALVLEAFSQILSAMVSNPQQSLGAFPLPEALLDQAETARTALRKRMITVLATFTAEPLAAALEHWMEQLCIPAQITFAPYQQVFQQLLDPTSSINTHHCGANLIFLRMADFFRYDSETSVKPLARIEALGEEVLGALRQAAESMKVPALIGFPPMSPDLDPAVRNACFKAEATLREALVNIPGLFVMALEQISDMYPVSDIHDPQADRLGHVPYTRRYFAAMGTLAARKIRATIDSPFKVLALDCDNTLWRGVVGEDGPLGVQITPEHQAFQCFLKEQRQAGMLLCLLSKNEEHDVHAVFEQNPYMVLSLNDLTALRVNWKPKSENLQELAQALSLGLNSFVFFDDSPIEQAEVTSRLPQVLVIPMPTEPRAIEALPKHLWALDRLKVTAEDTKRATSYSQNLERRALLATSDSFEKFIASLDLEIDILPAGKEHVSRVSQLSMRTNQFNFTTVRRSEAEIQRLLDDPDWSISIAYVRDRFGDYGLVGVLIAQIQPDLLLLDTWLMSCRVLGRGVEHRLFAHLGELAQSHNCSRVDIPFIASPRNTPAFQFIQPIGLEVRQERETGWIYAFAADQVANHIWKPEAPPEVEPDKPKAIEHPDQTRRAHFYQNVLQTGTTLEAILEALKARASRQRMLSTEFRAPSTPQEQAVSQVWQELLGLDRLGVADNFFALGGNSLLATQVVARLKRMGHGALTLVDLFAAPTVASLVERMEHLEGSEDEPHQIIAPKPREAGAETALSLAQQRLWILDQLEGAGSAYNLFSGVYLRGPLQVDAMRQALETILNRHQILRTVFPQKEGVPYQKLGEVVTLEFAVEHPENQPIESWVKAAADHLASLHFDLVHGPLYQFRLLQTNENEHVLLAAMHHLVADGWSVHVFIRELSQLYRAFSQGRGNPLPALPIQFSDFSEWQRAYLTPELLETQSDFWRRKLSEAPHLLELPTDYPRPSIQTYVGATLPLTIDGELAHKLRALSQEHNATIYMALLAAFQTLLGRFANQELVAVGSPVAGRHRQELEPLIGMFVNTLVFLGDLRGHPSFSTLLKRTRDMTLSAFANQDLPFEKLVDLLNVPRDLAYSPVFQVLFILQDHPASPGEAFPDLDAQFLEIDRKTSAFDLTLVLHDGLDTIPGHIEYNTDLFDKATIARMATLFTKLLQHAVDAPQLPLSTVDLLTRSDRQVLLQDWNATAMPLEPAFVHQFLAQAASRSKAALTFGNKSWSYDELEQNVNQLSHFLVQLGVGPETRVAIFLERGEGLVRSLLAVLQAGGTYIPLDPIYPADRIAYILEDAAPAVVISESCLAGSLPEHAGSTLLLDQWTAEKPCGRLPNRVTGAHAAYVIYTSGSTGKPKGVVIQHRALMNFLQTMAQHLDLKQDDVLVAVTTVSFDIAGLELFLPLMLNATLVLADRETALDGLALSELLASSKATAMQATPASWRMLLEAGWQGDDQLLALCGGEALPPDLAKALLPAVRGLWNLYGPTETTIWSTVHAVRAQDLDTDRTAVAIGKPIGNTTTYVLGRHARPAPLGVAGELLIGGTGVSRGYAGRPRLTAEKFVPNPFAQSNDESRLYRTGDLVRFRKGEDLLLDFIGRVDFQVKLRGFRIELGEIEALLDTVPSILQSIAMIRQDGPAGAQLAAYVRLEADQELDPAAIKAFLKGFLPDYMVPTAFVHQTEFPLTPNGKVNRKALPAPDQGELGQQQAYVPPGNPVEAVLCQIWSDMLHQDQVGIHHNFFDLGGHSLIATQVLARIHKTLGLTLPLRALFEAPTVALLAKALETQGQKGDAAPVIPLAPRDARAQGRLSFAQERLWVLSQMVGQSAAYNMAMTFRLKGHVDAGLMDRALVAVIRRHEILHTRYRENDQGITAILGLPPASVLAFEDLGAMGRGERDAAAGRRAQNAMVQPFDLATDFPIRAQLLQLDAKEFMLTLCVHHIASDGWSTGILVNELATFYRAFEADALPALLPLPIQYFDYAQWQRGENHGELLQQQRDFWKNALASAPTKTPLPYDMAPPRQRNYQGNQQSLRLHPQLISQAKAFAGQQQAGLFSVLLSALNILLHRWTLAEDLVVGTVVAGRQQTELEPLIGCFMNFLALRSQSNSSLSGEAFVLKTRSVVLDAFAHQECPFEQVLTDRREQEANVKGLYNVAFLLQNHLGRTPFTDQIQAEPVALESGAALLDLRFIGFELEDNGLELVCEYDVDLFTRETVALVLEGFAHMLKVVVTKPSQAIESIGLPKALLEQAERARAAQSKRQITILSTFTAEPVADALEYWMDQLSIPAEVRFAPYQQIFQQLLDPASAINSNRFGANLLFLRMADFLRYEGHTARILPAQIQALCEELLDALRQAADKMQVPALICFPPTAADLDPWVVEACLKAEAKLREALVAIPGFYVMSLAHLTDTYAVSEIHDPQADNVGHIPFTPSYFAALGTLAARKIRAAIDTPFKVLALDCDNTLWQGVVGEDGPLGVRITPEHKAFQHFLKKQRQAGMLLCLLSKNEEHDVRAVFEQNSDMVLSLEDLTALRVNWQSKSENIHELAEALSLGLNSFVFFDDNPVEQAEVATRIPQALVIPMPTEARAIAALPKHLWALDRLNVTAEDTKRAASYGHNLERKALLATSDSFEKFIASLNLTIDLAPAEKEHVQRVSQLSMRTNQFNFTTVRRSEAEIQRLLDDPDWVVSIAHVRDRFGDYGLVGVLVAHVLPDRLLLDTWLMSCRVLGRGVEHRLFAHLGELAQLHDCSRVDIPFIPSPRNTPAFQFIEPLGVDVREARDTGWVYQFTTDDVASHVWQPEPPQAAEPNRPKPMNQTPQTQRAEFFQSVLESGTNIESILAALKARASRQRFLSTEFQPPSNPQEHTVSQIWQELLGLDRLGVADNFFALGGNSLLATQFVARMKRMGYGALSLGDLFEEPTVAGLVTRLEKQEDDLGVAHPIIAQRPREVGAESPLSLGQQRLWILDQLEGAGAAYNLFSGVRLRGHLDSNKMGQALETIIHRHQVLRTVFPERDGVPYQLLGQTVSLELMVEQAGNQEIKPWVETALDQIASMRFDLVKGPLYHFRLLKTGENEHLLLAAMHHLIADGWSVQVFIRELSLLYQAFSQGEIDPLPVLPIQFADYADWQQQYLSAERLAQQADFWRKTLAEAPHLLELPTDRPRPSVQTYAGSTLPLEIDAVLAKKLRKLSQEHHATIYMTLLAAFQSLLGRFANQDLVPVGSPIAGRNREEFEPLIGMFVNTLVLLGDLRGDPSFATLLKQTRRQTLAAFAHQDLPFEKLVDLLDVPRDLSYSPVFQVLFILQDNPVSPGNAFPELQAEFLEIGKQTSAFDLTLELRDGLDTIPGHIEYNTDLFDKATIARMATLFTKLLQHAVDAPQLPLSTVDLLTRSDRQVLLQEWNATAMPLEPVFVHQFLAQAASRSKAALTFGSKSWRYDELEQNVNQLSHFLVQLGVGPETRVAIFLERGEGLVRSLLAVLQAGGTYIPLDPIYPADRIAYILEDAAPAVVISESCLAGSLPEHAGSTLLLDQWTAEKPCGRLPNRVTGAHAAYVIYTSGSTGKPKGVVIQHRALMNFLQTMAQHLDLKQDDVLVAVTTVSFDIAGLELFLPLMLNATLVLADRETALDGLALSELLASSKATAMQATPASWRMLLEAGWQGDDQLLALCGGEALPPDLAKALLPAVRGLWNLYGPTETTIWSTVHAVRAQDLDTDRTAVAIGKPIGNTTTYVLDRHARPAPLGVAGELLIGGTGVSRGYAGRPRLTAEKFVPNPFAQSNDESRLYRTGDLVRFRKGEDLLLDFIGRVDFQVKLRGFRIELGEIEALLDTVPSILQSIAMVRQDGPAGAQLAAYVRLEADQELDPAAIKTFLSGFLPDYMVPTAFVNQAEFPLTPNGKVNRKALPAPDREQVLANEAFVAPRTATEILIAGIWADVLGLERVGVSQNFFDLGGHSLLATQVLARIRDTAGVSLGLRNLFEAPTVEGLAIALDRIDRTAQLPEVPISLIPREEGRTYPLSYTQQRLWFLAQLDGPQAAYNLSTALQIKGPFEPAAMEAALTDLVSRHETLRTSFGMGDGEGVQSISPPQPFSLSVIDLDDPSELKDLASQEAAEPFDLEHGPLFRITLFRIGVDHHALFLSVHHIVSDGWSLGVLARDIVALYTAHSEGKPVALPALPAQFVDYAQWQKDWLKGQRTTSQLAFWGKYLAGAPPLLELPTDRSRPSVQTFRGMEINFRLNSDLSQGLKALARERNATLFMGLSAVFSLMLGRYARQKDVVFGTPIAGRKRRELEDINGFFANTLALRIRLEEAGSIAELIDLARASTLAAFAHQDVPFEQVVDHLQPARNLAFTPIFQAMMVLQNAPVGTLEAGELSFSAISQQIATVQCDLRVEFIDGDQGLHAGFQFNTDLFDKQTIERMWHSFELLVEGFLAQPEANPLSLAMMSAAEQTLTLETWNQTTFDFDSDQAIHQIIEQQAAQNPTKQALVYEDQSLSYELYNQAANKVAHRLLAQGFAPETPVGVCMTRSLEMCIALLGILKAGGYYVPLNPTHPRERLAMAIADAGMSLVLCQGQWRDIVADLTDQALVVDVASQNSTSCENPNLPIRGDQLAYAIYTSGSTGRPKGVMNTHHGIYNRIQWMQAQYRLKSTDRILQKTPFTFDVSVWEFFWAHMYGACLVVARPEGHKDPSYLVDVIESQHITAMHFVPSMLQAFLEHPDIAKLRSLRQVFCSGEALKPAQVEGFFRAHPTGRLYNLYGPTEAAVDVSYYDCLRECAVPGSIPIGNPVANTQLFILDELGYPCPIGVPGELHIGGIQLARGYLQAPGLTAEKFVPNPFVKGAGRAERLYRTGDLTRFMPDGSIVYMGRIDDQVKIRGVRIECGDIEATLEHHSRVLLSAVLVHEDAVIGKHLVGFVSAQGPPLNEEAQTALIKELKTHLAEHLPEAYIPAQLVITASMPLLSNGKINRRALVVPDRAQASSQATFFAPRNQTERQIAAIWCDILQLEKVDINTSFFEFGGHSILMIKVHLKLKEFFGDELTLVELFQFPTIRRLGTHLREKLGLSCSQNRRVREDRANARSQEQTTTNRRSAANRRRRARIRTKK